jgi:hypothetical protein
VVGLNESIVFEDTSFFLVKMLVAANNAVKVECIPLNSSAPAARSD